jgi:hypothetical protein
MNILVDREQVQDSIDYINLSLKYLVDRSVVKYDLNKALDVLCGMLKNPMVMEDDSITEEEINQQVSDSAYSFMNNPDPRCDGCEYQHPYLKNMKIDEINNGVYCERGIKPPYCKDGKTIQYDPALKICHRFEYNNALIPKSQTTGPQIPVRFVPGATNEENIQAIKDAIANDLTNEARHLIDNEKCEACFGNHHNAIIEMLDMLVENEAEKTKHKGIGEGFESMLSFNLNKLRGKLVGEECD